MACEMFWLKIVLKELGYDSDSVRLYCGNRVAIYITHNPVQHYRIKHVKIDRHFIKEKVRAGIICTSYVKAGEQLADILTKAVSSSTFHAILSKLGLQDMFVSA